MTDFTGRRALVTGGATGIGRAIAARLASGGARVAIAGRRAPLLETEAHALGAVAVPGDVTVAPDRTRILERTLERLGGLDLLVNNAGAVGAGALDEVGEDEWDRLLAVNVKAPMLLAREALPALRDGGGAILNVSTGAALKPVSGFGVYGASKAALNYASQVLAVEAAPHVRVNVLCPGGVDTAIFDTFLAPDEIEKTKTWYAETAPLGRIATPDDVADAAVWLLSDAARFVTGAVLPVDGGLNLE